MTFTGNLLFDSLPKPVRSVCLQVAERRDVDFGEVGFPRLFGRLAWLVKRDS